MTDQVYGSVAETGAKPGDKVTCVSCDDALHGVRYIPGRQYVVQNWFGRPAVNGQLHGKKCGIGEERWLIPFDGFGATWRLS